MDKKEYLKTRIFAKLHKDPYYNDMYDEEVAKTADVLIDENKLDIMPIKEKNFEDSVLSYVNFCSLISTLILNGVTISPESVEAYYIVEEPTVLTPRRSDEVSEELLQEEDPDVKKERLLILAEEATEDFTSDFDSEELTEVGLRERNLIEKSATSLDGEEVTVASTIPVVRLKSRDDIIVSPFTGSEDVYLVSTGVWADYETEQKFRVEYN